MELSARLTVVPGPLKRIAEEPTTRKNAPTCALVDHGEHGTGEVLALELRRGNASPFNSANHVTCLDAVLTQLPEAERAQVLVRTDAGGRLQRVPAPHHRRGLQYSIGFPANCPAQAAIETTPESAHGEIGMSAVSELVQGEWMRIGGAPPTHTPVEM